MSTDDEPDIYRATPEQIVRLLSVATFASTTEEAVPAVVLDVAERRRLLSEIPAGGVGTADPLLDAISPPGAPVETLARMKRLAGSLEPPSAAHRDVLTLVYHAAVAAAFGRYGAVLTSRPIESRREIYWALAGSLEEGPLRALFRAAVEYAARLEMQNPTDTD